MQTLREQRSSEVQKKRGFLNHPNSGNTTSDDEHDKPSAADPKNGPFQVYSGKEEIKDTSLDFNLDNFKKILEDKNSLEASLVNAKMHWATLELERDNLQIQYRHDTQKLQKEIMDTKEKLGEALNSAYEYERRHSELFSSIRTEEQQPEQKIEKTEKGTKTAKRSFFKLKK